MAFVTFEIDDPDKELRERAKINARHRGTTVSAILRDCFLALAGGEESHSVGREVALVTTVSQDTAAAKVEPSSTATGVASSIGEHASERASNGNGHQRLTVCPVCEGRKVFRNSISLEDITCWKCDGKGSI